jgi:hypothetical protein
MKKIIINLMKRMARERNYNKKTPVTPQHPLYTQRNTVPFSH